MKRIDLTLPPVLGGNQLYPVLRDQLPGLSQRCLRAAFDRRDVKMDGVRVSREAETRAGAQVQIFISDDCMNLSPEILYEDARLLVVRKPAGISCDKDDAGSLTMGEWLFRDAPSPFMQEPLPCHRLDNPTDGLMLYAKDEPTRAVMEQAFRERRVHKRYVCLVRGEPNPPEAVLDAYLLKDAQRAKVRVLDQPVAGALPIRTGYRLITGGEVSRLEVTLYTGRTHQIRAHLAYLGHPLLGDDKYGDRAFNRAQHARRLMLTATELTFDLTGELAYLNAMRFAIQPEF